MRREGGEERVPEKEGEVDGDGGRQTGTHQPAARGVVWGRGGGGGGYSSLTAAMPPKDILSDRPPRYQARGMTARGEEGGPAAGRGEGAG